VLDEELGPSRLKVRVVAERGEPLDERVVGGGRVSVGGGDGVVEGGEDARRAFLFDEVADDLEREEGEESAEQSWPIRDVQPREEDVPCC
jgi:hypothetical protein